MDGRLSKYFGTPKDSDGNPLYWSNPDSFPFRGMPPTMLKGDEIEQIPLVFDAKSELLELPRDQKRYDEIIDHCANGWWHLRHERFIDLTSKDPERILVFMAWLEVYGETPQGKSAWEAIKNAPKIESR